MANTQFSAVLESVTGEPAGVASTGNPNRSASPVAPDVPVTPEAPEASPGVAAAALEPMPAGFCSPSPSELREILFRGRGGPAGMALANSEAVYGQLLKECRGKPPAWVVDRLWEVLDRSFTRLLAGPGEHPRDLPPANSDRIAWDQAALLYIKLTDQVAKAWRSGGAWRDALEAKVVAGRAA